MRIAFSWVMFGAICINISVGLMFLLIPEMSNVVTLQPNLEYIGADSEWVTGLNTSVNPSGVLEDRGNAIYRLLDSINLGFIARFLDLIQTGMFGFEKLLAGIFEGKLLESDPSVSYFWFGNPAGLHFGVIKGLTVLMYGITAISFWTGKEMVDR